MWLRRTVIPGLLAVGLAIAAMVTLAGGVLLGRRGEQRALANCDDSRSYRVRAEDLLLQASADARPHRLAERAPRWLASDSRQRFHEIVGELRWLTPRGM